MLESQQDCRASAPANPVRTVPSPSNSPGVEKLLCKPPAPCDGTAPLTLGRA